MELLDQSFIAEENTALDQPLNLENSAVDAQQEVTPNEESTPVGKQDLINRLIEISALADTEINNDEVSRIKQQFYTLHNEEVRAARQAFVDAGNQPEAFVAAADSLEEQLKQLLAGIKEKKAAMRARIEAEQLANLDKKQAIIAELNAMSADTDNVNRHYPRAKELQAEFKEIGEVPQQNSTDTWKAFQDAVELFYDQWKVNKELRDYDFKKNLAEKQLLISEARKLTDEPDVVTAFKRLQELHDKWREVGPVAKEQRDEIWAEFKDASADVNKRYQAFFEERKKREQENETAKTALCEEIEAIDIESLKTYNAWNQATQQIIDAQEKWKTLGFASRKTNNALFARFRACCDAFFNAKAEFFRTMKDELAANLAAKTALCEQAEALKDSTDWKATADKLAELQKQWKTIGAVPKKHSDTVWKRFLAACDYFFEQKKQATSSVRKSEQANLKIKRGIVEALNKLNAPDADTPREEAIKQLHELRAQWQATGHVPFREKDKLHDTYREVVRQLFDKYDVHENRARMTNFESAINELASDNSRLLRERERLVRTYENRRNDLNTYENNLGFFNSKTKSGDSMLRELEHKIQFIKNDIAELEKKIELIDSKL